VVINTCQSIFVRNFENCWPIFRILSPLDSAVNSQQGLCHTSHRTLCHYTTCEIQRATIAILLMYLIQYNIIDLFLKISICVLSNRIKCCHEHTPRDVCVTHTSLHHRWPFVPSHARSSLDDASVHRCHELDECANVSMHVSVTQEYNTCN